MFAKVVHMKHRCFSNSTTHLNYLQYKAWNMTAMHDTSVVTLFGSPSFYSLQDLSVHTDRQGYIEVCWQLYVTSLQRLEVWVPIICRRQPNWKNTKRSSTYVMRQRNIRMVEVIVLNIVVCVAFPIIPKNICVHFVTPL